MKIGSWFTILLLLFTATAAKTSAADKSKPETVRWTIQKLKIVHNEIRIFVIGSNGQYISKPCSRYESESVKYHFWREEAYEIKGKCFYGDTFAKGFSAIVSERAMNKPDDILANLIAKSCFEKEDRIQNGEYALKDMDCTEDHCIRDDLWKKVNSRLEVISEGNLVIEKAVEKDQFELPTLTVSYAKLVLIEKQTGKRFPFLLRSDNNPTIEFMKN